MIAFIRKLDALLEARLEEWRWRSWHRAMVQIRTRDNLMQIEDRLTMCESVLPHDAKVALFLTRKLLAELPNNYFRRPS